MTLPGPRLTLAAMAAACLTALALALVAEHRYAMFPCAWCVVQRVAYILIALLCGLAACLKPGWPQRLLAGAALLISGGGIAAALFQHTVAALQNSCARSWADRVLNKLELDALMPEVFSVTATCAEANVSVLGVPFALWSMALFSVLTVGAAWALWRGR